MLILAGCGVEASCFLRRVCVVYRRLGGTGLMVSELCLGCMTFGRELGEEGSREIIDRFLEAGGNFIDTADVYEKGLSEEITGRAIKGVRDELVLATKVRFPMGEGPNDVGLSRKHVISGCEASLRRLGTDYSDLYQVHAWDAATPLEETLSALTDLVHQGKVRYIGVSNFTGWQLMKALSVSEIKGFERFVSLQPQYSLVERNIEREVLPAGRRASGSSSGARWEAASSWASTGAAKSRRKTRALPERRTGWRKPGRDGPSGATGGR